MSARRGLHRTTRALEGEERSVPLDRLVFLLPRAAHVDLFVPERGAHNRWHFPGPPFVVRDTVWLDSLVPLRPQGHYFLSSPLAFDGGTWPARALVQLGYSRLGEPMLFLAQLRAERRDNVLQFGGEGVRVNDDDLARLEPVALFVEPGADGPEWGR